MREYTLEVFFNNQHITVTYKAENELSAIQNFLFNANVYDEKFYMFNFTNGFYYVPVNKLEYVRILK